MQNRVIRTFISVLAGILILAGAILLLRWTVGNHETLYAGKPLDAWVKQLNSHDAGASNQANETLNTQIIPRLVDQMFHDTNDSTLRLSLVNILNGIPAGHVHFTTAANRRTAAAADLGIFGPPANAAVPALIQALKGPQSELHEAAIQSLGSIHSEADLVIPLLITYLTNDDLNEDAATAIGDYGSAAKEAFPNIVLLLHARDTHTRIAAHIALKQIDPDEAAKYQVGAHRKNAQ